MRVATVVAVIAWGLVGAVGAMGEAPPPAAASRVPDELLARLRSADRQVRREALRELVHRLPQGPGEPLDPRVIEPCAAALRDPDKEVCLSALTVLSASGDRRALAPLLACLRHADPQVRCYAANAVGGLCRSGVRDPAALVPLGAAVRDKDPRVGGAAAYALGSTGLAPALAPLLAAAKHASPDVRAGAIAGLGELAKAGQRDPRIRPALVTATRDAAVGVRASALSGLVGCGDPEALAVVVAAAKDAEPGVRSAAARALTGADDRARPEMEAQVRMRLAMEIDANFRGVPLEAALRQLQDALGGLNIHANWPALTQHGVDKTTRVTVVAGRVPAIAVLWDILLAAGTPGQLGWAVREGVLVVSTRADLERPAPGPAAADAAPAVPSKLDQPVDVSFKGVPLKDALQYGREISGLNVHVLWRSLQAIGVEPEAPVDLQLRQVPLRAALRLILSAAGEGARFEVKDDLVLVGAAADVGALARGPSLARIESGDSTPVPAALRQKLSQPVPADFEHVELQTVLAYGREVSGVGITVNWVALRAAGVEPSSPVSLRIRNAPFALVLRLALCDVAPSGGLDFVVKGGAVHIVTKAKPAR